MIGILGYKIKKTIDVLRYFLLNPRVWLQIIGLKKIPLFIISYNRLSYLKILLNSLGENTGLQIIILDNNSSYEPLLKFYETCEYQVVRMNFNYGHRVVDLNNVKFQKYIKRQLYFVTDNDLELKKKLNRVSVLYMIFINVINLNKHKVGYSLKIDDLPNKYIFKDKVISWESKFWKDKTCLGNYVSDIDTTLALYKPQILMSHYRFHSGIRLSSPYLASHLPWYADCSLESSEDIYYKITANKSSSWLQLNNKLKYGEYE